MTAPRVRMLKCPHCDAPCRKSSSRPVTRLVREEYYSCTELVDCGHTFVVQTEVVRTLTPSRRPRPGIAIPFGISRSSPTAPPAPANDPLPLAAEA